MARRLDGTTIYLTRGDTLLLQLDISMKNGTPYTPQSGDIITFALKRNRINPNTREFIDSEPLILKEIPTSTLLLELEPEDTASLSFDEPYVYDIQLEYGNGEIDTFVEEAKFVLKREVH